MLSVSHLRADHPLRCRRASAVLALALSAQSSAAGSATWKANPPTALWNSANNWQPKTIPNGDADIATFNQTTQTDLSFSSGIAVGGMVFDPSASAYTFTIGPSQTLALTGAGLTNNSGVAQNFVATTDAAAWCFLLRRAPATPL